MMQKSTSGWRPWLKNAVAQSPYYLALTELTRLGEPKCLHGYEGDPTIEKGELARRVTLLAESIFCFSCERLAKCCKEM